MRATAQVELATYNAGYVSMNLSVSFSRGVRDFDVSCVELTGGELLGLHPVAWGDNDNLLVIEVRVVPHTHTHTHAIRCCRLPWFRQHHPALSNPEPEERLKGAPTSRCHRAGAVPPERSIRGACRAPPCGDTYEQMEGTRQAIDASVRHPTHPAQTDSRGETRRRGHACVTQGGEQMTGRWYHTYLLEVAWTADRLTAHIPFGAAYDINGYITEPSNVYTLALTNQFHVDLSPFTVDAGSLEQEVSARHVRGVCWHARAPIIPLCAHPSALRPLADFFR